MAQDSKDKVFQYLHELTSRCNEWDEQSFCAASVASKVHISRSLASLYMNALASEGKLIKVSGRPVLFFSRAALEERHGISFCETSFISVVELLEYINSHTSDRYEFQDLVGANGSLYEVIDYAKAAVCYPPRGLPLLLLGNDTEGLSLFRSALIRWCASQRIIRGAQEAHCIDAGDLVSCMSNNASMPVGPVGLLWITGCERLDESAWKRIISFCGLSEGYDDARRLDPKYVAARIVFECGGEERPASLKRLGTNIPFMIRFPSFLERPFDEREAYVYQAFQEESKTIGKKIYVSSGVVQGLASASGDVGVRRVVRLACAAALASAGPSVSSDAIKVLDVHIPAGDGVRLSDIGVKDYTLLSVDDYDPIKEREDIFESLSLFIRRVAALPCACIPGEQEESQVHQALVRYFDVVEKHYRAQRSDILGVIAQLSDLAFERYGMSKPVGFSRRVAASCMLFRENYLAVSAWRVGTRELVASAERVARAHYAFEQTVAASVAQTLQDKLGWEMGRENALVFSYYLHWCTRDREMPCAAIIATHGFSTATSIADAANTILHHHVFDAVDMPLDSAVDEVERDLVQVLQRVPQTRDVLIMIDMGSLKDMSKRLSMHLEANVGIVDNVSLAMALEAGALLLRRQPLGDILSKAVECGRSHATLHRAERVRKVVLFISENGIASARRLAELFAQSLPAEMEFDVLPLDYLSAAHEILDGMFHDMHVALVVGPSNPGVQGVDFLPFERLVNMSENDLSSIELGRHVDEAILNEFRSNLMKHFTLNNIMKRLTVLEPERLMDVIESSVGRLQQHLGMSFSTHMLLWLYVHVAYLVERIVTRQYINEQDLGSFVENEQEFIEKVRDSFRDVEAVYGVELPLGEIHYVFSLINNDSAYRGEGDVDEY